VDITFASDSLRTTCESEKALKRAHGKWCAKKAMARLADLDAASSLETVRNLPGRCHELKGDRAGQLAVTLADGKRLIFEPSEEPLPAKPDGGLDWTQVGAIRVLQILDYHD